MRRLLFSLSFVKVFLAFASTQWACPLAHAAGVTWEDQAERLQNVNASLLDSVPFLEPPGTDALQLQWRGALSLLPKVNAKVGSKTEDVPSAPVHMLPVVQVVSPIFGGGLWPRSMIWAGYLPNGSQKLLKVRAAFTQWILGGGLAWQGRWVGQDFWLPLGVQWGRARVSGAITGADAHDTFSAQTALVTFAPTLVGSQGFWSQLSLSSKRTRSTFEIPSDSTRLTLTDALQDQAWGWITQGSVGVILANGLTLGLGVQWTPGRLVMPRALLAYGTRGL